MSTRERWLAEGLAVLAAEGESGVRVDRIAGRIGLTKGSFHHHFQGVEDYRHALLDRHESDQIAVITRLAAELADTPPDVALVGLPARFASQIDSDLERAVRAWGISDPAAQAMQERLDVARLAFLRGLWVRLLGDTQRAHTSALVPHLIAIGASVTRPRLTTAELRAVYDFLATLANDVTTNP